jgi:ectoine hydroxylase-related dioxygenase (phytanoyl-CoA dioxygenase family)
MATQAAFKLSETDVSGYWERGYWISPTLLAEERVGRLRRAVERLFRGQFDGDGWSYENEWRGRPADPTPLRKLTNGWWVSDEIRDLVLDPLLGGIAARLMRAEEARLWHDQVIWKPGTAGQPLSAAGNVGWHQDYAYWNCTTTDNMVSAWVALQDTDLLNGGMRTLAGSHRWGLAEEADTFDDRDLDELERRFSRHARSRWIDEPCVLKAGQVSFHHSLCFHGSGPNRTDRARLSIVGHYMPGDCGYRPGARYHRNIRFLGPRPRAGQLFAGDYFPRVFPPAGHGSDHGDQP